MTSPDLHQRARAEFLERNRRPHPLTPEQAETVGRIVAGVAREQGRAS